MAARSQQDDFGDRLRLVMERGDLTIGDIHHWFGRSRPTVRYWVKHGHGLYGVGSKTRDMVYGQLRLLENAVDAALKAGEPLFPPTLKVMDRPAYVKRLRDECSRVFETGPA